MAVEQTHEGHPFLLVVLETYHFSIKHLGTCLDNRRWLAGRQLFLLVALGGEQYARAGAVAVDGAAFAARTPGFHVEAVDKFFVHVVGQVDGNADGVVYPFLDASLHLDLHQPVHVVGCRFIIRRAGYHIVYFFLCIAFGGIQPLCFHPGDEFRMEDDVFFEGVARFVHEVDACVRVVGVHLAAAFVYRQEYGFDTRSGLRH